MTSSNYTIAEYLKMPIAIIGEGGDIHWRNRAFEAVFGDDAALRGEDFFATLFVADRLVLLFFAIAVLSVTGPSLRHC